MWIQRLTLTVTVVETTTITIAQTGEHYEEDTIDLAGQHDGHRAERGGLRRPRDGSAGSAAHDDGSAGPASSGSAGGGPAGG